MKVQEVLVASYTPPFIEVLRVDVLQRPIELTVHLGKLGHAAGRAWRAVQGGEVPATVGPGLTGSQPIFGESILGAVRQRTRQRAMPECDQRPAW